MLATGMHEECAHARRCVHYPSLLSKLSAHSHRRMHAPTQVKAILELPVLVVLDEAYIEFRWGGWLWPCAVGVGVHSYLGFALNQVIYVVVSAVATCSLPGSKVHVDFRPVVPVTMRKALFQALTPAHLRVRPCSTEPSKIKWVQEYNNLVVLRTFSKSAGARAQHTPQFCCSIQHMGWLA